MSALNTRLITLMYKMHIQNHELSENTHHRDETISHWRNKGFGERNAPDIAKEVADYVMKKVEQNELIEKELTNKERTKKTLTEKELTKDRNTKSQIEESRVWFNATFGDTPSSDSIKNWLLESEKPEVQFAILMRNLKTIFNNPDLNGFDKLDKYSDDIDNVIRETFYFSKEYESSNSDISKAAMKIVDQYYKEFGPVYNKYVESNGKKYKKETIDALKSLVSSVESNDEKYKEGAESVLDALANAAKQKSREGSGITPKTSSAAVASEPNNSVNN